MVRSCVSSACEECHRTKSKCDGKIPCSRCAVKGLRCIRYKQKKRGRKKRTWHAPAFSYDECRTQWFIDNADMLEFYILL